MANVLLSEAEKVFILHGVQENIRNDGRSCRDYRLMEIETDIVSNTSGSAHIRLANTDILVGVKAELDAPYPDKPDFGRIEFFTDCSANATPEFEGKGGDEIALEVSSTLKSAFNNVQCLDLKSLCVLPGQQCWILYVDILILECGGNLYDAVSLAVKAALHNTKIPSVSVTTDESNNVELEVSDDPFNFQRLSVKNVPTLVTLTKIGDKLVVDPTLEEEECSFANIVMAVNEDGKVYLTKKVGSGSFHPETVFDALEIGVQVGQAVNKKLMQKLIEEEGIGKMRKKKGFL